MEPIHLKAIADLNRTGTTDPDSFYQHNSCDLLHKIKRILHAGRRIGAMRPTSPQPRALKT